MKTNSPLPTYIAYSVGYFDDADIVNWVQGYLPTSEHFSDNSTLLEMAWINPKDPRSVETAGTLLEQFVAENWPGYDLNNAKAELYAKRYFTHRLKSYLDGNVSPWLVCRMVSPIENLYDFPVWLGKMYDACDWIDQSTKLQDCPHLRDMVQETLENI